MEKYAQENIVYSLNRFKSCNLGKALRNLLLRLFNKIEKVNEHFMTEGQIPFINCKLSWGDWEKIAISTSGNLAFKIKKCCTDCQ